jgi:hypothetical protein
VKFTKGDSHGIHYALSIFIAAAALWLVVHELAEAWCPRFASRIWTLTSSGGRVPHSFAVFE